MTGQRGEKNSKAETVVVAIDKDKGSQAALKWAVDNLLGKGKIVTLLHVKPKTSSALEDADVARALCDYVRSNSIETLVVGSPVKTGLVRFKTADIAGSVTKGVPDFCTVYVISKGKVASVKSAGASIIKEGSRPQPNGSNHPPSGTTADARFGQVYGTRGMQPFAAKTVPMEEMDTIKSPFTRGKAANRPYGELTMPDTDISFVSPVRPSNERMNSLLDQDPMLGPRLSNSSDPENILSFGSPFSNARSSDANNNFGVYSSSSQESGNFSWSGSQSLETKKLI